MTAPLTPSEALTHTLCTDSFLSLWCYNNPRGKKSKELCDVLVVCDPDVILFSVKDIKLDNPDDSTSVDRWRRKAIEGSIKQLDGAERWLASAHAVVQADGSPGIGLPLVGERRTHRIAVACGSNGSVPIVSVVDDERFTHVFTEHDLVTVLEELNTITDFVSYLRAKEDLLTAGGCVVTQGTEADLLAVYLCGHRSFPTKPDLLVIEEGCWAAHQREPSFAERKQADNGSFIWDDLIGMFADGLSLDASGDAWSLAERERATRQMAREDRFCRRKLTDGLTGFLKAAKAGRSRARMLHSPSLSSPRNVYVVCRFRADEERSERLAELHDRCLVALNVLDDVPDFALGIGFGEKRPGVGSENDIVLIDVSGLEPDRWRLEAKRLQDEVGYFRTMVEQRIPGQEFPS